jgi:hypothetical protein
MPSYARGTMLFCPAEGPPVSINGRVDSGAIMIGAGGSRDVRGKVGPILNIIPAYYIM